MDQNSAAMSERVTLLVHRDGFNAPIAIVIGIII